MNVHIRWNDITDSIDRNRNKIYDFDQLQDYAISGPNQMWYNELFYLSFYDIACSAIWVNDELVYDIEKLQGWNVSSYWYKEMWKSIKQEREFNEIVEIFEKSPIISQSR